MNAENHQTSSDPSSSSNLMDATSSLRAAALLSRKRRRIAPDALLRPTLESSPQLDYGQDDSTSGQVSPADVKPTPQPQISRASTSTLTHTPDAEDGQREEGEISESETLPALLQQRTPTPPARVPLRTSSIPQLHRQEPGTAEIGPLPPLRDVDSTSPSEAMGHPWQARVHPSNEPFVPERPPYWLDDSHVRPGLLMTQSQYDTAKDIVLDLLGWGVPSEYLLDCGISREIIYYVFTELNLRLPSNLNASDLVPYPTPEMLASPLWVQSSSISMPPPTTIPARDSLGVYTTTDQADSVLSSPAHSPKVKAEPVSPSPADLSLIEQQRRQELLARKAVIASRRSRQGDPTDVTITADKGLDVDAIPSQFVDDFLKTIESGHPTSPNEDDHVSTIRSVRGRGPESMDIDEAAAGFVASEVEFSNSLVGPLAAQTLSPVVAAPSSPTSTPSEPASGPLRSTSSRYVPSALVTSPDMAVDPTTLHKQMSLDPDSVHPYRRGSKRPVAADFVDFDSGPGPSRSHRGPYSSNGYSNGGSQLLRRKTGSFAGISNMRRCVIELSDSEDDGDGKVLGRIANGNGREYSPTVVPAPIRHPSRPASTSTPPVTLSSDNVGSSAMVSSSASGPGIAAPSTATLMEKEEEIKKMRQLIAEREETRLRKLAAVGVGVGFVCLATLTVHVDVWQVNACGPAPRETGYSKARRYISELA
ncbi:hypothetical protein ID866_3522 [Astraeus odoratus]|nr:hypothetical protein ID866_3522 [Astraeus odoratus]